MSLQTNDNRSFAIILLAAGTSSRLGHPKQLLPYDGQTLVRHSLQIAQASTAFPIIIVLGAQAGVIEREVSQAEVHIVVNTDWQEGMGSSIRSGVSYLVETHPFIEGAILMVCDQPYVTPSVLNDLIITHQNTGKPIVTCSYANTFGPPTFFHKSLFSELLQLKADVGARGILRQHSDETEVVIFPDGALDIDTEADYQKLSKDKREL